MATLPWQDPNVVAYLSALNQLKQQFDLQNSQITAQQQALTAESGRQEGNVKADTQRQLSDLGVQGTNSRTQISGQYQARGLGNSGENENALALQRQAEGRQQSALQAGSANQISNIEANLAQQQAALEQQRAQARMQFQQRGLTV